MKFRAWEDFSFKTYVFLAVFKQFFFNFKSLQSFFLSKSSLTFQNFLSFFLSLSTFISFQSFYWSMSSLKFDLSSLELPSLTFFTYNPPPSLVLFSHNIWKQFRSFKEENLHFFKSVECNFNYWWCFYCWLVARNFLISFSAALIN